MNKDVYILNLNVSITFFFLYVMQRISSARVALTRVHRPTAAIDRLMFLAQWRTEDFARRPNSEGAQWLK